MRARSNPPSVLAIFSFAVYPGLLQETAALFDFAPCGTAFSFRTWKPQDLIPSQYAKPDLFSALLPAISDHPSPGHISCTEGGVSSAMMGFVIQNSVDSSMKPLQSPPAHHRSANTTKMYKAPTHRNYDNTEHRSRNLDLLGWYVDAKCT